MTWLLAALLLPAAAGGQQLDLSTAHAPDLPGPAPVRSRAGGPSAQSSDKIGRKQLRRNLRSLARQAPSASGVYVYDIDAPGRRKKIFADGAGKRRKLASNTKLFTTATALDRFGPDGRLQTQVKQRGRLLPSGKLKGDLYLIGGGDPSLGSGGMAELAQQVRRAGIEKVRGRIVADDSIFDRKRGVPDSGFGPSPYIAPLSGLTYGGSTYSGDPAIASASAFRSALSGQGIAVKRGLARRRQPDRLRSREPLAEYSSPTMGALAQATNFPSNNFYAEMLLKSSAAAGGKRGTTKRGTKAVERFARQLGSKVDSRDGSGLTDKNRASARNVVGLLAGMRDHEARAVFYDSLPRAGKEGTVASRMRGSVAEGRCRAKTGTISGVSALSGYCRAGRGGKIAFSILMNGVYNTTSARYLQDRMVIEIARYRP